MSLLLSIILTVVTDLVLTGAVILLVLDAIDKGESLRKRIPGFERFIQREESLKVLVLACIVMLALNSFEVMKKEVPEIPKPPTIVVKAPFPPIIQTPIAAVVLPRMRVEDAKGPLNGRTIFQSDAGDLNFPDPLWVRNVGSIQAHQVTARLYFSEVVALSVRGFWESSGTGYDDFPFELWTGANVPVSPREKWNLPTIQGKRANIAWAKLITVKLEVFSGGEKPETAIFKIAKK